jgi:hypothetical protein
LTRNYDLKVGLPSAFYNTKQPDKLILASLSKAYSLPPQKKKKKKKNPTLFSAILHWNDN